MSEGQRRGSPVRWIDVVVEPWYERYAASTFGRPLCTRAIRTACSMASVPPVVKARARARPGRLDDHSRRFAADVGCMGGRERAQPIGLLLDGGDDAGCW